MKWILWSPDGTYSRGTIEADTKLDALTVARDLYGPAIRPTQIRRAA
jgi:hypothetical protein